MKKLLLLAIIGLACTTQPVAKHYDGGSVGPDEAVALAPMVDSLANGQTVTWSVESGGGTIDQTGRYTAPGCTQLLAAVPAGTDMAAAGMITAVDKVTATWSGGNVAINITIAEAVLGVTITPSSGSVGVGETVQFTAQVQYTCHTQSK